MKIVGILEDDPARQSEFRNAVSDLGATPRLFDNADDFVEWLAAGVKTAALLSLDGDLFGSPKVDPGSGLDVARHLAGIPPAPLTIIVHSANRKLASEMMQIMEAVRWKVLRLDPVPDDGLDVRIDPVGWIRQRWKEVARAALGKAAP